MNPFTKAKVTALVLFVTISAGFVTYHFMYAAPAQKCEASGRWWAAKYRQCVVPLSVSSITGRPNPTRPAPDAPQGPAPVSAKAP